MIEKGKAELGRMDVIVRDTHPETRMKRWMYQEKSYCANAEISRGNAGGECEGSEKQYTR